MKLVRYVEIHAQGDGQGHIYNSHFGDQSTLARQVFSLCPCVQVFWIVLNWCPGIVTNTVPTVLPQLRYLVLDFNCLWFDTQFLATLRENATALKYLALLGTHTFIIAKALPLVTASFPHLHTLSQKLDCAPWGDMATALPGVPSGISQLPLPCCIAQPRAYPT